ncbi:MAG TPA: gluconeogenesis factor YvcK family protein [Anaeromyxobacter sp.]
MTPLESSLAPFPIAAAQTRPIRIVAAGGGTGLPRVLAGLAPGVEPEGGRPVDVTAVVTTADDGGSSGELRRAYGTPAPGDVRNCLVALAEGPNPLAAVLQHRFEGGALDGHTVGNVLLTALAQKLGSFEDAVAAVADLLGARGRVLPGAAGPVELVARLEDGRVVRGERAIARAGGRVEEVRLARPVDAPAEAVRAVLGADLVVLGPGSLYSSILASLLAGGMAEALRETSAVRVLVVNLFTQPGETDGYAASDHVRAVTRHLGDVVDVALVQRPPLPAALVAAQAERGAHPVALDRAGLDALGAVARVTDLLAPGGVPRHDPQKVARALLAIARAR